MNGTWGFSGYPTQGKFHFFLEETGKTLCGKTYKLAPYQPNNRPQCKRCNLKMLRLLGTPIHEEYKGGIKKRFYYHVQKTKTCWLWIGTKFRQGGGNFTIYKDGKRISVIAHNIAWELAHGKKPENMAVLHQCENIQCVRPSHLYLDDPKKAIQNRDEKRRNRGAKRERHHNAKITQDKAELIRRLHKEGESKRSLGRNFGLHPKSIHSIILHKTWKSIKKDALILLPNDFVKGTDHEKPHINQIKNIEAFYQAEQVIYIPPTGKQMVMKG